MKSKLYFILLIGLTPAFLTAQSYSSVEDQVSIAVKAAPQDLRSDATVLGYDEYGELSVIKEGSNYMVCLADDPNREGISVACYHKDLEPFMKRGRELKAEGKKSDEIFEIRENEAKAGSLQMPDHPSTLYVLSGKEAEYFSANDSLAGASLRYVVYIPFATAESTGLPLKPSTPGEPWIMDPGTHRAHIMITPPRD